MKYYVFKTITNEGKTTKSVYDFSTLREAEASAHSEYGKALTATEKNPLVDNVLIMIINSTGGVHETFYFNNTENI